MIIEQSIREISNMEKVLLGHRSKDGRHLPASPIGFLQDSDGMRRCLIASCIWKARGLLAKKECKGVGGLIPHIGGVAIGLQK